MKHRFFRNLLFLLTLNILVKPFWVFGIDRVVQNFVGTNQYGIYFSLFNLSILFNIILDFGLTNFNNRNISQHNQLLTKYFSNIVVLKLILSIFYAIITISIGLFLKYDFERFKILFLLILNQFLLSMILYLRSNISGLQLFKIDSLISVLDRFLMIAIISFLLFSKFTRSSFNINFFVLSQTFSYLITMLIAFFFVLKKAKSFKIRLNKPFLVSILKNTFPYALLVLLMSFYNRFDAVLLERLLPDGEIQAGIYAQSFRLLDAFSQFSLLFATLLLPMFAKMIKNKESISELVNFSFILILVPSLIIVLTSIFYNFDIISALYKDYNVASSKVFVLLFINFIPISVAYIYGTLLTANGNLRHLNFIALGGLIINLTLNLILIPVLKAQGSAIAAIATQFFTAASEMFFVFRIFKVQFPLKKILAIIVFTSVLIILTICIKNLHFYWLFKYLLSIILGFLAALLLRLISIKESLKLIFYKNNQQKNEA